MLGSELRYEVIRLQHKTKHKLLDFFPVEFTRNRKTTTEDLRSTYKSRFRRFVEPAELSFRVVAGDYRKTVEAGLGSDAEVPLPNVPQPRIAKVLTLNTRKEDSAGLQLVIMLHVMNNKKNKTRNDSLGVDLNPEKPHLGGLALALDSTLIYYGIRLASASV